MYSKVAIFSAVLAIAAISSYFLNENNNTSDMEMIPKGLVLKDSTVSLPYNEDIYKVLFGINYVASRPRSIGDILYMPYVALVPPPAMVAPFVPILKVYDTSSNMLNLKYDIKSAQVPRYFQFGFDLTNSNTQKKIVRLDCDAAETLEGHSASMNLTIGTDELSTGAFIVAGSTSFSNLWRSTLHAPGISDIANSKYQVYSYIKATNENIPTEFRIGILNTQTMTSVIEVTNNAIAMATTQFIHHGGEIFQSKSHRNEYFAVLPMLNINLLTRSISSEVFVYKFDETANTFSVVDTVSLPNAVGSYSINHNLDRVLITTYQSPVPTYLQTPITPSNSTAPYPNDQVFIYEISKSGNLSLRSKSNLNARVIGCAWSPDDDSVALTTDAISTDSSNSQLLTFKTKSSKSRLEFEYSTPAPRNAISAWWITDDRLVVGGAPSQYIQDTQLYSKK